MPITDNHIYFFISYATSFLVMALIGKWYLYPAVKNLPLKAALTPLLLYACLRVNGLTFLMPGVVREDLPQEFALPTAYGDLTAVILALLALWALRNDLALARPLLWLFNIVGLLDLIYAQIATFIYDVDPASLGASYYLVVLNVPAMVVVHIIMILLLLRSDTTEKTSS
jgi:hypothetical protein